MGGRVQFSSEKDGVRKKVWVKLWLMKLHCKLCDSPLALPSKSWVAGLDAGAMGAKALAEANRRKRA